MRSIYLPIVIVLILSVNLFAEQDEETLFGSDIHSGWFGSPIIKGTYFSRDLSIFTGIRWGWIVNNQYIFSYSSYDYTYDEKTDKVYEDNIPLYLDMSYSGIDFEYVKKPHSLIHYNVKTFIGWGKIRYKVKRGDFVDYDTYKFVDSGFENDYFFIIEPELIAEMNINKWFKVSIGSGFRFVTDIELDGYKNSDIMGPTVNLSMKFGKF